MGFLGIPSGDLGIVFPDEHHVAFDIPGGLKWRPHAPNFALVVQKTEHDRNPRAEGDVVETGLPVGYFLASARRRHRENEAVVVVKVLNGLFDNVVGSRAIDRYSPKPAEDETKRSAKEGSFSEPVHLGPHGKRNRHGEHQIPI